MAWKQITIAVIVGFLLGGVFTQWQIRENLHGRWESSDQKKERMMRRFATELKLTPGQKEKVEKILDSSYAQMEAVRGEMRPKLRAIREEMKREIRTHLTPEQLKQFDLMEKKWKARKDKWTHRENSDR